jgi:mRNA-degrading endonuclease toxin of MazEF toxin-antitoxin module
MNPGDIRWVEFPAGAGRAQAGRRPAIILQGASASAKLPTVIVVPLTTQQDALRFPGTVLIEPDEANGLRHASVALVFQITVLDLHFLGSQLGTLSEAQLQGLWQALDDLLGRDS